MKRRRSVLLIFLILLMVGTPFVVPAGHQGILDEDIASFGETRSSDVLIPPDVSPFELSTDGDQSSDSITSFSETLADDVLFYPDSLNGSFLATSGDYNAVLGGGSSYDLSHADDGYTFNAYDDVAAIQAFISLEWGNPDYRSTDAAIITLTDVFSIDAGDAPPMDCNSYNIYVYDYVATTWDLLAGPYTQSVWNSYDSYTLYTEAPEYFTGNFSIKIESTTGTAGDKPTVGIDYASVEFHYMTMADSAHYAESFFDVSDWTFDSESGSTSYTFTSDGDIGTFTYDWLDGGNDWVKYNVSVSCVLESYLELRWKRATGTEAASYLTIYADEGGWVELYTGSVGTWTTAKIYLPTYLTVAPTTLQVYINDYANTYDVPYGGWTSIDYMRIAPTNELGWQYDGSYTTGDEISKGASTTVTTDGDKLNMTASSTVQSVNFFINGQGATDDIISTTTYPFVEWSITSVTDGTSDGNVWLLRAYNSDGTYTNLPPTEAAYTDATGTFRANLNAIESTIKYFKLYLQDSGDSLLLDYIKMYSIAKFSVRDNADVDNIAYVSSNVLVVETVVDVDYFQFTYNHPLTTNTATYNIFNISVNDINPTGSTDFNFKPKVDAVEESHADDARGEFTNTAGTLESFSFRVYTVSTMRVSSIKFWTDATDPVIDNIFVNPPDPYDDESVSFTITCTDWTSVESVTLNMAEYPSGFSDVNYALAEQSVTNIWLYTFSSMTAGYYLVGVTIDDGQGTDTDYITLTVRESEIDVDTITLFGAGSDFTHMQWSFKINKDCTYVINEVSENNPASDTHSGSVSEGTRNIAWLKLSTIDTKVNFTVTFTNDSLTYVFGSSYEVAQTTLAINSYDWGFTQNEVLLNYDVTKGGTYTVYLDEVQDSTGAFTTGSNFLNWSRPSSTSPSEVRAAVKVTDGTTTLWMNRTYDEYSVTALSIQTLTLSTTGPNITTFVQTSLGNATITVYQDDVQKATGAEGTTLAYSKSTTAGTYSVAIKIFAGATAGTKWHNDTYTVAIDYAWSTIYVFDQGDPATYIPWQGFDLYVNSSLIDENEFYDRTDYVYNIVLKDKFGDVVYNQTQAFARTYRLTLAMYSLKVKCLVDGAVEVYITSSGGGILSTWLGWNDVQEWWVYGSKTYQVKWLLDSVNHTKVKGDTWHYYPALDWEGNQVTPNPTWYTPSDAFMIEIDAFGIGYIYGAIPDPSGGGGGLNVQELIDEFNPLMFAAGKGRIGIILLAFFGSLAYLQYKTTRKRGPEPVSSDSDESEEKPPEPQSGSKKPSELRERQKERKEIERQR